MAKQKVYKFKAYKGGAGPTEEQIKNNTMWVTRILEQIGKAYKVVPIKSTPNGKDLMVEDDAVTVRVGRHYIDYDRWGFVVTRGNDLILDQCSDKVLVDWILRKFAKDKEFVLDI